MKNAEIPQARNFATSQLRNLLAVGMMVAALCGCDSAVTLERGKTEVVVAKDAPKTVRFAAEEMTNFLSRVLSCDVKIVETPTAGMSPIHLADGVEGLPRDGFTISASEGRVVIAGNNDKKADLAQLIREGKVDGPRGRSIKCCGEHATLFGVYEFLERVAGVRFYFPGEIGTVIPKKASLKVPCGKISVAPAWTVRNIYLSGDGAWPGEDYEKCVTSRTAPKCLDWLRLRLQTEDIPCCHGINGFCFSDRFGATHPEWFYLRKTVDGSLKRGTGTGKDGYGLKNQMCYTNDELWEQVYKDTVAYFEGKDPQTLGIPRQWNSDERGWPATFSGDFVDVMAQDGMQECHCEKCQAAYDKSLGISGYATELVWTKTAALARRLKAAGYPAIVTQMAYTPYQKLPTCDLPDNLWVMVAQGGPWCMGSSEVFSNQQAVVRGWAEKLGHKVWMWTYPAKHPHFELGIPGIPDIAPHAWGDYYRTMSQWSLGSFCESEVERSILHYLNYYVYAKLAWNPDLDLDALLDEHYRVMFGAGAAEMKAAFELCERKWIHEVAGNTVDTPLGPQTQAPSTPELWMKIWGKASMDELTAHLDAAERLTAGDPEAEKRVAFIRREIFDPFYAAREKAMDEIDPERALARRKANPPKNNLVANGSFDDNAKGWSFAGPNKPDASTFMSPPCSFKVTNPDGKGWSVCTQSMKGKLKPKAKYRISFFVKLDGVKRLNRTGHSCWAILFDGARWYCHPGDKGKLLGTADWFYCERTFETGDKPEDDSKAYLSWGFNGDMIGTAWVDDIVLEEAR